MRDDPLGRSVTDLSDATGAAQWTYEYEAYGAPRTATDVSGSAPENRLRFNGQYLDPETSLYHLRARQYDPASGRFGALDPVESALDAPSDSPYGYVNGRPTVLDDPSGLDPTLGGATLDCSRNAYLCKLMYGVGLRDQGCRGQCMLRALTKLAGRGITVDTIVAVANGKGKIVNAGDGPDGPGIYLVGGGKATIIRAPKGPNCGFVCSLGLATTKLLDCDSKTSCVIQAAMFIGPGKLKCAGRVGRAIGLDARTASNQTLQNVLNNLYKAGQRYGGGTAGALRIEARTGIKIKGRNHRDSAEQYASALRKILAGKRGQLSADDRHTAFRNLRDLEDAIRHFDQKRPQGYLR